MTEYEKKEAEQLLSISRNLKIDDYGYYVDLQEAADLLSDCLYFIQHLLCEDYDL